MNIYLIFILLYLLFMILLGVFYAKREVKTSEDFMVAGRRLPKFVLIGTLLATFIGSGSLISGASFIYQYGPYASIIFNLGVPIGIIVLYFIAGKARSFSKYTVPELLEMRFGKVTKTIAAVVILLAYTGIASYQFIGGGYVLNITTGMSVELGTLITAATVIFLATTGGMFSVAYTDFISALLIFIGFIMGLPIALSAVEGFGGISSNLSDSKMSWNGGLSIPQLIGFFLPPMLLVLGDQNMYQRFSSAKNPETAKKSVLGFLFGMIILMPIIITLALVSAVLLPNINPDTAILNLAANGLPITIGIVILMASVAFIITTGNSYLLSSAGNLVYDLIQGIKKNKIPEEKLLGMNRYIIIFLGVFSYIIGQFFPSVLAIQMYSYTLYGAAITPSILASFFWKRATTSGVLTSIIAGGASTLVWELAFQRPMGWNSVLISLPLSVISLIVVSLLTKPKIELSTAKHHSIGG